MKIFDRKTVGVTKKFALKAARYRRVARQNGWPKDSFTKENLIAQYEWESKGLGDKPDPKKNGFTYGKWLIDITNADIHQSIIDGDFLKCEFLETAIQRIHNTEFMEGIIPGKFFAQSYYREAYERKVH